MPARIISPLLLLFAIGAVVSSPPRGVTTPMEVLEKKDVLTILRSVVQPFNNLKDRRNKELDMALNKTLAAFAPVLPEMISLAKSMSRMDVQFPENGMALIKDVVGSLTFLTKSAEHMETIFSQCPTSITLSPGLTRDEVPTPLVRQMENMGGLDMEREAKASDELQIKFEPLIEDDQLIELATGLTCDAACRQLAIGDENSGKHVPIEDVVEVFNGIITHALNAHTHRFLKLVPAINSAGNSVRTMAQLMTNATKGVNGLQLVASQADSILKEYSKGGHRIYRKVSRLGC